MNFATGALGSPQRGSAIRRTNVPGVSGRRMASGAGSPLIASRSRLVSVAGDR